MNSTGIETNRSQIFYEELSLDMSAEISRKISTSDVDQFAELSCDTNPLHLDEEYAASTPFKTRIVHGSLCASLISAVLGTKLPGPGCIYISQAIRFKAPVRIGDTVVARVKIEKLVSEKQFVEIGTRCFVGNKLVIDGEAIVMVPSVSSVHK